MAISQTTIVAITEATRDIVVAAVQAKAGSLPANELPKWSAQFFDTVFDVIAKHYS